MPRTRSSIEKIRAELTWVHQPLDPNKCSCRHLRCCEDTNHSAGICLRSVETQLGRGERNTCFYPAAITSGATGRCLAQDCAPVRHWLSGNGNDDGRPRVARKHFARHDLFSLVMQRSRFMASLH